ncbi:MAG: Tm-1-like ATP-binding domain-containing protein [Planctomycetaceae bacterium]|nr:Tm-1-like ATP-binding domain-containing protein [Planctomycetaceae bacterium]
MPGMNESDRKAVCVVATLDTKAAEARFVADCLRNAGVRVKVVDVGTAQPPAITPDVPREKILAGRVLSAERTACFAAMSSGLADWLASAAAQQEVAGVIGLGGSCGTSMITAGMRALPVGLPRLMVSTMASGNVADYVGATDITMMYSVVDIAGLNRVSQVVLSNAAHAMFGMVQAAPVAFSPRPCLAMTMFGVTTPCVTQVRNRLEAEGSDCLVFHATGAGGRAMESLIASGMISGVLDITTTEVADRVVGGIMAAGPERFEAAVHAQLPFVLSLGAVDMVNFGPRSSVPDAFANRLLHEHNAEVTLMRTSAAENAQMADFIADRLAAATRPFAVVMPEGGVSVLDEPGGKFWAPEINSVLFDRLQSRLDTHPHARVIRSARHINDPQFADLLCDEFQQVAESD